MQVRGIIVGRINIDVVDDFTPPGIGNLPVLPLTAGTLGAISQSMVANGQGRMRSAGLLDGWVSRWLSLRYLCHGADHHVLAAPPMGAVRHAINLLLVGVERIAVVAPHLIVAGAQVARRGWSVAMRARPANDLSAPAVFRRSVLLPPLEVHEAEPMRGMLSPTLWDRAKAVLLGWCHAQHNTTKQDSREANWPVFFLLLQGRYKALGNSMAVPVMSWIGKRIASVQELQVA